MLTHLRRLLMGEHLVPRAGHSENAADLALSLGRREHPPKPTHVPQPPASQT